MKKYNMQIRDFINAHKITTPFVVLGMMYYFNAWSVTAWVYLALHGTYCLLWIIKEYTFRDKRFEEPINPIIGFLFVFTMLGLYWIAPYIITSRHIEAPGWIISLSVFLTMLGVFYHFVSDAYKYAILSTKKELITTGLFSKTRNPNYLGEMLIYLGFALLALNWLPFVALAYWWSYFFINMLRKEKSISRYSGYKEWTKKSWLLFPKIW